MFQKATHKYFIQAQIICSSIVRGSIDKRQVHFQLQKSSVDDISTQPNCELLNRSNEEEHISHESRHLPTVYIYQQV